MSFLADLRKAIKEEASGYLATHGFVEVAFRDGNGMGALVQYRSPELGLLFVLDRSQVTVDVVGAGNPDTAWRCDTPRLMALVNLGPLGQGSKDAHVAMLTTVHSFKENVAFLKEHHPALVQLLSQERISTTAKQIDELGHLRAQMLFGPQKSST